MTATFASCCDGRGQFSGWGRRPATRRVIDMDEAFAMLQPWYGRCGCKGLPASRPIPSIGRPRKVDAHDVVHGHFVRPNSTATKTRPHAGPPPIPAVQDGDGGVASRLTQDALQRDMQVGHNEALDERGGRYPGRTVCRSRCPRNCPHKLQPG